MAEKEYIERGNIEKWLLTEMASLDTEEDRKFVVERIRGEIPAADVRPVVRGKWKPDYDSTEYDFDGSTPLPEPRIFQDGWQCSLCGQYTPSKTNFCPNCGADMREES